VISPQLDPAEGFVSADYSDSRRQRRAASRTSAAGLRHIGCARRMITSPSISI